MKKFIQYIFILLAVIFFSACKKYPKNTLWFKHPGKVLGERDYDRSWILDHYSVNDVDSTDQDFLKAFREVGIFMFKGDKTSIEYRCPGIIGGYISFFEQKNAVIFSGSRYYFTGNGSGYVSQRFIFLDPSIKWKILKLNKKAFWVNTEFNNVKYEIHFK